MRSPVSSFPSCGTMPTHSRIMAVLVSFLAVICLGSITMGASYPAQAQQMTPFPSAVMSAAQAHQKALAKELILIDIRRPGEWRQTGVPATAQTITMHQSAASFFGQLNAAILLDKTRPIAIICATGVRTSYLQRILRKRGYSNIINVAEGMLGSRYGVGWIKAGLPIRKIKK